MGLWRAQPAAISCVIQENGIMQCLAERQGEMSQQMNFDEEQQRGYQASYTPTLEDQHGSYNQRFAEAPGQKLGTTPAYSGASRIASAGQRLALAIVSVFALVAGLAMLTNGDTSSFMLMGFKLIGLVAFCITIAVINFAFNWRR
jgi:hypothetical protein